MRSRIVRISVPSNRHITTILPVEAHFSKRTQSNGFDHLAWHKMIGRVRKDPNAYIIFVGDMIDALRPSARDRRAMCFAEQERRPECSESDLDHQDGLRSGIIHDLKPIAHKILAMIDGDHYMAYQDGTTSTQFIAETLGIPQTYLGERMGYVRITFQLGESDWRNYDVLVRHGKGGTGTLGGDVNAALKQAQAFDADLHVSGHTHKIFFTNETHLWLNKVGQIKDRIVSYARAGSLLRTFSNTDTTYGERAEYSPLTIGWPEIQVTTQKDCHSNNGNLGVVSVKGLV